MVDSLILPIEASSNSIVQMVKHDLEKRGLYGKLYLTGSRFFKTVDENSDWDFFYDRDHVHDYPASVLSDWEHLSAGYVDRSIAYVFSKTFFMGSIRIPVHLQIVNWAEVKWIAQNEMLKDGHGELLKRLKREPMGTHTSRDLWNNYLHAAFKKQKRIPGFNVP